MGTCFKEYGYLKKSTDGTVKCSSEDSPLSRLKKMLPVEDKVSTHRLQYALNYKDEEYEEREYPSATWLCTKVTGIYQDSAVIEGFRKIQAYTMGDNIAEARLAIEPPILTRVTSADDFSFERTFMVCVYLSDEKEVKHPKPANPHVVIKRLPAMTVFVRSFTGVATEERWTVETRRLTDMLRCEEDVRTDCYLTAIYHSPFQISSSQNEVWLLKYQHKASSDLIPVGEENMIQVGNRHFETSPLVSTLLYFALVFVSIVLSFGKTALQMFGYIVDNKDPIVQQTKSVARTVSLRRISRTVVGIAGMCRTFGKAFFTAAMAEYDNGTSMMVEDTT